MDNKDDWEELRKWEESKKQSTIFYENETIKNDRNKKASKISKRINILGTTVGIPILIICTIAVIYLTVIIVSFFQELKKEAEIDILEQLKNQYSQNFIMIQEKQIAEKEYIYKISPEKDRSIIFTAVQKNYNQVNDYQQFLVKKFVKKYIGNNNTNINFTEDNTNTFLKIIYGIEVKEYKEIEKAIKELYDCNEYIEKSLKQETTNKNFYFNGYLKVGKWEREIHNNIYKKDFEIYCKEIQYDYIDYLEKNNLLDSSLSSEEKYKIWKPKDLKVYANDKLVTEKGNDVAIYNVELQEYEIRLNVLIKYIDNIGKLYDERGKFIGISYKKKNYEMYYEENERKGNKIPYQCRTSILEEVFQANIEYDYELKRIFITIK